MKSDYKDALIRVLLAFLEEDDKDDEGENPSDVLDHAPVNDKPLLVTSTLSPSAS